MRRNAPGAVEGCKLIRGGQDIARMRHPVGQEALPELYPATWEKIPGDPGFTKYVQRLLNAANIERSMSCTKEAGDRWYQRVLAYLVHPSTPIHRLLVVWQLGTGKTIGMIRILENFFDDERPKLLLFPTQAVVDNFYGELATTPSRFRDWLRKSTELGPWPAEKDDMNVDDLVKLEGDRAQYVEKARELLSQWPKAIAGNAFSGLAAPLRAFTYAQAGGPKQGKNLLNNAMLRWPPKGTAGYVDRESNDHDVMRNMIVLCDEPWVRFRYRVQFAAHNLIHPPANADFGACRTRVFSATGSVVVLFTATPVLTGEHGTQEALDMMQLTRGVENDLKGTEGFVSWFMERPPSIFAAVKPPTRRLRHTDPFHDAGRADNPEAEALMPNIYPVALDRVVSKPFWDAYAALRMAPAHAASYGAKLGSPGGCVVRRPGLPPCVARLAAYEHTLAGGDPKEENKMIAKLTLDNATQLCPKLAAIAASIQAVPLKTLVLIHEENGPAVLVRLLELHNIKALRLRKVPITTGKPAQTVRAENTIALRSFNAPDNVHGRKHRVAVASAEEFSEGVSFMQTRRVILADLSPGLERPSWALVKQRIGRALRSCSHQALPSHMRTLVVDLFVAVHERPATHPLTIDLEKLLLVQSEVPDVEKAMQLLADSSLDGPSFYNTAAPKGKTRPGMKEIRLDNFGWRAGLFGDWLPRRRL